MAGLTVKMPRLKLDAKWGMLGIALLAGAVAAWLSQRHIQARIDSIEAGARTETVELVVASADLAAGTRLDAESVAVRSVPVAWASPSAVTPDQFAAVGGAALAFSVSGGEPILWAHVRADRAPHLSERLDDGRRAVTIPVDEMSSVSGLIKPGDVIDLYVSFEHRGGRATQPLLQSVKVLATGQQLDTDAAGPGEGGHAFSTLTLDVSPQDAVKLIAARDGGTMTAMLRPPDDARPAATVPRGGLAGMLGVAEAEPPRRAGPRVAIIYGDRAPRSVPRLAPAPGMQAVTAGGTEPEKAEAGDDDEDAAP